MQWTYEIRGSHPQYKIPSVQGGRLNNKLSKEQAQVINVKEKKNFMRTNLQATKYASPAKSMGGATQRSVQQLALGTRNQDSPPRR